MTGKKVDDFVAKIHEVTEQLPVEQFSEILTRAVRMDATMHKKGMTRPVWLCQWPESAVIGENVVFPTETGERVGKVVYFGVARSGDSFERSVFVIIPSSGSWHEVPGSVIRPAGEEDLKRMMHEVEMAAAIERVENAPPAEPKTRKRKHERDPEFTKKLVDMAIESGLSVERKKTFHKVTGPQPGRALYVAVDALRADFNGFTVDHPAVRQISAEEARDSHLGGVRGQLKFEDRDAAEEAFIAALGQLV